MRCEECDAPLWRAGEYVPPGVYVRAGDDTNAIIPLHAGECLPASFDGHIAIYRTSGCACAQHHCQPSVTTIPPDIATPDCIATRTDH